MGVTLPPVTACCFYSLLFTLYTAHTPYKLQWTDRAYRRHDSRTRVRCVRLYPEPRPPPVRRGVRSGLWRGVVSRPRGRYTAYTIHVEYTLQPTAYTAHVAFRCARGPLGGAVAGVGRGVRVGRWRAAAGRVGAVVCVVFSAPAGCRAGWATCDGRSVAYWLISACRCPFARSYLVTVDSYRHGSGAAPRAALR